MIDYPLLERHTDEIGNRKYIVPNGKRLPSVTTILSNSGDKTFLENWKNWVGHDKAEDIRNEAGKIGTLMHEHLEAYIEQRERPTANTYARKLVKNMSEQIIANGLSKVDEVWGIEKALYSSLGWAGTADLIGTYQGVPSIMDYKNTRKLKTKSDELITPENKLGEYYCQLTAYIISHNEMFPDKKIRQGVIFMVDRELNFETYVLREDLLEFWNDIWLTRVAEYYSKNPELIELLD
jgi:hypothetical protein